MHQSLRGDEVIATVLDEVLNLKGWDPTSIYPDQCLGKDLEMSVAEIALFAQRLSERFLAGGSFDCKDWSDISLRQVVVLIRSAFSRTG
jgi:hypothetical protein